MPRFNSSTVPSVISVHSGTAYLDGLSAYNQATNLLGTSANTIQPLPKTINKTLKQWYRRRPNHATYSNVRLKRLSEYLQAVFANPLAYGCVPFVDMLYLTIDVSETTISDLPRAIKSYSGTLLKRTKTGPSKHLKKVENKDIYQKFASFLNSHGSEIRLYWGLHKKVKEKRLKQRLMKVSLNPARHTPAEMTEFFAWLKGVIGQEAQHLLEVANVTRLDIAMDIHGLPIQYLLIDRPNVKNRSFHANEKSNKGVVGTQRFGRPDSNCTRAYNKVRKYLDLGPCYVDLLVYDIDELRYIPVSRVERVFRPADTTPIVFGALEKAPYFLKGTEIYKPKYLIYLHDRKRTLVGQYGFAYWYYEIDKKQWRKYKVMQRHKYHIDDVALFSHQTSVLSVLKNIIINA